MGVSKGAHALGEMSTREAMLRGVSLTDGGWDWECAVKVTLPS